MLKKDILINHLLIIGLYLPDLKQILQRKDVVKAPVVALHGGQYRRIVDVGEVIGQTSLKHGGVDTSWIAIYTDSHGNLISAYPVKGP